MNKRKRVLIIYFFAALFVCVCVSLRFPAHLFAQKSSQGNAAKHYYLSKQLDTQQKYDEAIIELEEALAIDPSFAKAHLMLGVEYSMKGWNDRAIEEFNKAISLGLDRYNTAVAHHNIGAIYIRKGMKKEALEKFRRALEIEPGFKDARVALARIGGKKPSRSWFRSKTQLTLPIVIFFIIFYVAIDILILANRIKRNKTIKEKQPLPGTVKYKDLGYEPDKARKQEGFERRQS